MALPEWDSDGFLPPAARGYAADLGDIYERCVTVGPNKPRREYLFTALTLYRSTATELIGPSTLLVSGGFVTAQTDSIGLEIVVIPDDFGAHRPLDDATMTRTHGMITQPSMIVGGDPYFGLKNVRPFAGALDAFMAAEHHRAIWHRKWSRVTDAVGNTVDNKTKGYLEVRA